MRASIASALLVSAASAQSALYGDRVSDVNHTCVLQQPIMSCDNRTAAPFRSNIDTCCVETFGGLVLTTQFWNTYTAYQDEGQLLPRDTWTIHGLWPDFCNGSYTQYCDLNRQYDPVPSPNTTNGLPN
ncbi:hypothetical protein LTS18_009590, partial [Coniosporium uncinatum]